MLNWRCQVNSQIINLLFILYLCFYVFLISITYIKEQFYMLNARNNSRRPRMPNQLPISTKLYNKLLRLKRLDWGCQINSQQTKKRTEIKKRRISLNQRPFVEDKAQDFGILVASAELFIAICRHSSGRDSLTFRLAFDNDAIRLEDNQAPP